MIVKICGIRDVDVAEAAVEAGADWIGLVRERSSPRWVDDRTAAAIAAAVGSRADLVGVFVEPDLTTCVADVDRFGLRAIQIHGRISDLIIADAPALVLRAVNPRRPTDAFRIDWPVDQLVLLDAPREPSGPFGGTGRTVDLDVAAAVASHRPIILAGGLTPDNVARAIRLVRPRGVDASSGLEHTPGVKDPSRVRAFVAAVRAVDAA